MPRLARKKSSTGIYHIMLRGINKQIIFEDDEDRFKFLATLRFYKDISNYKIYGYCLMDNHIHLLIGETDESISVIIKRICSSFVYWYNMKYKRCGHLFQERFKSETVEQYINFLSVLRYIHRNPVKAKLANCVAACKWTSYQEYLRKTSFVDTDLALLYFSNDLSKAIPLFTQFMNENNTDQCIDDFERIILSDDEVRRYLTQVGITDISALQKLEREQRNTILSRLKKVNGISIRQLARVTGISKSVIQKCKDRGTGPLSRLVDNGPN